MSRKQLGDSGPRRPEPERVKQAFQSHHTHFSEVSGEVALQQLETEQGIKRQYAGRVLYELLQNALDSASSEILVQLLEVDEREHDHVLVVANDGDELTVDPEYDYESPPEHREAQRPDFNALCSIRTSNKSADDSVGNKGIGFRSVFAVGDHARVWSQFSEASGWWGIEMHLPINRATWERRLEDPPVQSGHESLLNTTQVGMSGDENRPSFHFPLPLYASDQPESLPNLDPFTTAVAVPIESKHLDHLRASFEEMRQNHLYFLGLFTDRKGISVRFETDESSFTRSTWPASDSAATHTLAYWESADLEDAAADADLDISTPGAAVAWPTSASLREPDDELPSRIYGYLPTKLSSPFNIDIHGDFQLRIDRTGLQLDDENIGAYNSKLLQIAAEIHLVQVVSHFDLATDRIRWEHIDPAEVQSTDTVTGTAVRDDIWQFLDPGIGNSAAENVVVNHIKDLLFTGDNRKSSEYYGLWADFAKEYFAEGSTFPADTYTDFWEASKHWVDHICPYSDSSQTWRDMVTGLCDAVRETEAQVVPVNPDATAENTETKAVPLPERSAGPGSGNRSRHSRAVFIRENDESLPLPEALRKENRAVTSFQFPSAIVNKSPQPLGTNPFNRWEVLSELRQLPNSNPRAKPDPLAEEPETAYEQQQELIRFAAELYCYESQGGKADPTNSDLFHPGWRTLEMPGIGKNARRAGRAIATLYLPSNDGMWQPARQLTLDQVDKSRLGPLPDQLDLDSFLTFLGVGPQRLVGEEEEERDAPPLTLIEGGAEGQVPPRAVPPQLTEAGQGNAPNVSLGVVPASPSDTASADAWRDALSGAWDDWLQTVVEAEREKRAADDSEPRSNLLEPLSSRRWYPIDSENSTATSPKVLEETENAVAPRSLTLLSRRQQRFPHVLWTARSESDDRELLTALGAIDGVDVETLSQEQSEPAFRLLTQLRTEIPLEAVSDNQVARQALVDLFNRIVEAIVATDGHETQPLDSLYLLCYEPAVEEVDGVALTDRTLNWKPLTENETWIVANSSDREIMRRFFPGVPLVAAEIGPRNLSNYEPLQDRGVTIDRAVEYEPLPSGVPDRTEIVETEIESVVPSLLALAEATLQLDIDAVTAVDNWQGRVFEHVHNGWIEYTATLGESRTEETTWLKGASGNAFYDDTETSTIRFDTESTDDPEVPPLAEFGEPLSALLFEEQRQDVSSLFARALSEYDGSDGEYRLEQFVAKTDAKPLVDSYERLFRPLSEAEEAELIAQTEAALAEVDLELVPAVHESYHRKLGPDDVVYRETAGEDHVVTQQEINTALNAVELSESQTPHAPQFRCESKHHREWQAWFDDHSERLIPYLTHLCQTNGSPDIETDDVEQQLETFISNSAVSRLDFEPENAVIRWLTDEQNIPADKVPSATSLETKFQKFSPRYQPVEQLPSSSDRAWRRRDWVDPPEQSDNEGGTFSESAAMERMRRQGAVGEDAELAFRHGVANQTAECLEQARSEGEFEAARELLFRPFASDGKTAQNLRKGIERWTESGRNEDLAEGLHISQVWDGAGFDLLGLECENGEYELVRYEVKALPESGSEAKVHLSSNQFAVYRDVCLKPDVETPEKYRGDWKLIGVGPNGTAEDLTADLEGLPGLLEDLRSAGFGHDGVVLHVNQETEE